MTPCLTMTLILGLLTQTAPSQPAGAKPDEAADRLAIMKTSVAEYRLTAADDHAKSYKLLVDPVLRFTNTVGNSKDGAVFLWLGEHKRPEVATQVFLTRDGRWIQELSSLSPKPLVAEAQGGTIWNPRSGGVEFKTINGAPKPADSEEQRLRQMRALTRDFIIEDDFRGNGWQTLRMLTKPFARYGAEGSELRDGALFCYVLTTDPEAYLMLEAREGKNGREWQYALAPMTIYALRASLKGSDVWNVPYRLPAARDSSEPFHLRGFTPEGGL